MKKDEAIYAVSAILAAGLGGLGTALKAEASDDLFAGIGLAVLCMGFYLQHRFAIAAGLGSAPPASVPGGGGFRGFPKFLQLAGVVLIYAGIAVWIAGRS